MQDNAESQIFYLYRNDWLDDVGMEAPDSMEEVNELAIAFAQNDVSGTGETIGLLVTPTVIDSSFGVRGYFQGYGAYPNAWIEQNGELVYGTVLPEMKTALDALKDLYSNGGINREFVTNDAGTDIPANKVGSFYGGYWVPAWPCNLQKDAYPEVDWKMVPIPSTTEGVPGKTTMSRNVIAGYNCLSSKAMAGADEAFVKILNAWIDIDKRWEDHVDNWGETLANVRGQAAESEGTHTMVAFWCPIYTYWALCQAVNQEAVNAALEAGSADTLELMRSRDLYDASVKYLNGIEEEGDGTAWGSYYSRIAKDGGVGLAYYTRDNGLFIYSEYYGSPTPTELEKGSTLWDMELKFYVDYIMGANTDWEGFVNNWKSQGGDAWTAEVNAQYKELNK